MTKSVDKIVFKKGLKKKIFMDIKKYFQKSKRNIRKKKPET